MSRFSKSIFLSYNLGRPHFPVFFLRLNKTIRPHFWNGLLCVVHSCTMYWWKLSLKRTHHIRQWQKYVSGVFYTDKVRTVPVYKILLTTFTSSNCFRFFPCYWVVKLRLYNIKNKKYTNSITKYFSIHYSWIYLTASISY